MNLLTNDYPDAILGQRTAPCLSLYQPTHRQHPENLQDPIRFGNLVKRLTQSLGKKYPRRATKQLLAPLHALAGDTRFWNKTYDGLAVLAAPDFFRVYRLQRPVPEMAVVANSFHTKPLLRIVQSADRYHVLALSRHEARLFEGNRDSIAEIEMAPEVPRTMDDALKRDVERDHATRTYGPIRLNSMGRHGAGDVKQNGIRSDTEHFFRAVDQAVLEHHSKPTDLPLLIAALPEHHNMFHAVSRNPNLLNEAIDIHPDDLSADALRERAWEKIQPNYLERLNWLTERFHVAGQRAQATDNLEKTAKAAVNGRVETLLLDTARQVPGWIDSLSGTVTLGDMEDPHIDDVLDDLGEHVLARGGEVVMVPTDRMPTRTGLAAIYRY